MLVGLASACVADLFGLLQMVLRTAQRMGELGILEHPQGDHPLGTPGFHWENPSDIFKNSTLEG